MTIENQVQDQAQNQNQVEGTETQVEDPAQVATVDTAARQAAIEVARAQIAKFGLTAQDLGLRKARKVSAKRPPVPVKYRDENGNSWSGRGKMATWMRAALEQGRTKEDFLVA